MNSRAPFVAAEANIAAQVAMLSERMRRGRSHNGRGFSNRMLDTTVAYMNAK